MRSTYRTTIPLKTNHNYKLNRSYTSYKLSTYFFPMKVSGVFICLGLFIGLFIITLLFSRNPIFCILDNSIEESATNINGFYVAMNGIYVHQKSQSIFLMDAFESMLQRYKDKTNGKLNTIIALKDSHWIIQDLSRNQILYSSLAKSQSINHPNNIQWIDNISYNPVALKSTCRGSLQNSPYSPNYYQDSNLQSLLHHPTNTCILLLLFYIFYLCVNNLVDHELVTISYEAIVTHNQYWRIFSSSLSHFDYLHIGFNAMTLYQIKDVELVYGSVVYFIQSLNLIVITIVICLGIQYCLIHYFQRVDQINQQSLGYSCVLFAWIVVVSSKMRQFCPILFYPSFCLDTEFIPLTSDWILPMNFGPLILLLITKLIIPQSSFIGHLSGILIGYPLAWNMMNWLSPYLLLSIFVTILIYRSNMFIWKCPGYNEITNNQTSYQDFVPLQEFRCYRILHWISYILSIVYLLIALTYGWQQIYFRGLVLFLLWSINKAQQCCWLSDSAKDGILSATGVSCCGIMLLGFMLLILTLGLDSINLGFLIGNRDELISTTIILDIINYWVLLVVYIIMISCEITCLVVIRLNMNTIRGTKTWLDFLRFDDSSFEKDLQFFRILVLIQYCKQLSSYCRFQTIQPIRGYRLVNEDANTSIHSDSIDINSNNEKLSNIAITSI